MALDRRTAVLSVAIGTATGFRSSVGMSVASMTWLRGSKYERLAVGGSAIATLGEVVVDKLPKTPSRLDPPALIVRTLVGGAAASLIARQRHDDARLPAVIGGISALAGSYAGHRYRGWASNHVPSVAAALAEDVVALAIGAAVLNDQQP